MVVQGLTWSQLGAPLLALCDWLRLEALLDAGRHCHECLFHVGAVFGRGLEEFDVEIIGQLLALFECDCLALPLAQDLRFPTQSGMGKPRIAMKLKVA